MVDSSMGADRRTLLQNALLALDEMQGKLDAATRERHEPIAIVGMACRFPGGANSPEEYWDLLRNGVDAVCGLPPERTELNDDFAALDPATLRGGFLRGIEEFDPRFFGISPREAISIDPQQRLVLETSWEALERAGIAPDSLGGSSTGVYIGVTNTDYGQILTRDFSALDVYIATGSALNAVAGRVSYTLGLNGPAVSVDTACSSSLVALHLAVQALRGRECNLALAGGVNVALFAQSFICMTRWGMLAGDGRCKTFDAAADGFVRGEGCGMVALKRLSDAQADGDHILAVIRGTAVNQDGRAGGFTVPSGPAQRAVIGAALQNAQVAPEQVQYVEAHGTGTALGDPIEVEALGAALAPGRAADRPLYLGSVKTNLGHLESASGMAGLIKVVLMMQHGQIPPHLHFHEPNPRIPWPDFPVKIATELTPWADVDGTRFAGISGFGLSGTNAHAVLESAPPQPTVVPQEETRPWKTLVLSAPSEAGLRAVAGRWAAWLGREPGVPVAAAAAAASTGRARLAHRLALPVAAGGAAGAASALAAYAAGGRAAGLAAGVAPAGAAGRLVFLFTGQGGLVAGAGRGLYAAEPAFRAALDDCAALLAPHLDRPLLAVLFAAAGTPAAALLGRAAWAQPALVALEWALYALWRSWGVAPAAVAGHSLGEYAAAAAAGVLDLGDALRLAAARGRLVDTLPGGGAMAALLVPEAEALAALAAVAARAAADPALGHAEVAAVNGPAHTVVSGDAGAVAAAVARIRAAGGRATPLATTHAFHSRRMDPLRDPFARELATVTFRPPTVPLYSTLTGGAAGADVATPEYWLRQLRAPVRFAAALAAAGADGHARFLEVGPAPTLAALGPDTLPHASFTPSLRTGRDESKSIADALGRLFVAGVEIDWAAVAGPHANRSADLPTYPFQRERYWTLAAQRRTALPNPGEHALLGRRLRSPFTPATIYESRVSATAPAYIDDHRIYGTTIFPGSGFIEMALAAAADAGNGQPGVERLEIQAPLLLPDAETTRQVQLALTPEGGDLYGVQIVSLDPASDDPTAAIGHAVGRVRVTAHTPAPAAVDLGQLAADLPEEMAVADYYAQLAEIGLNYGPAFRRLTRLRRGDGVALGMIHLPSSADDGTRYRLHPAQLDACFHVIGAALPADVRDEDSVYVPVEIADLTLFREAPAVLWCLAEVERPERLPAETLTTRLHLYDGDGQPVATIGRLLVRRAPRSALAPGAASGIADWFYRQIWQPLEQEAAAPAPQPGRWVVFADAAEQGDSLAQGLINNGAAVITVLPGPDEVLTGERRTIDPRDPDGMRRLFATIPSDEPLRGVVYGWGVDSADDPLDGTTLNGALHLAQALGTITSSAPRLWLVTRGAAAVDGEPTTIRPTAAALWGFGRTVAAEQPALACTLLDLDQVGGQYGERVAELLLGADDEDQIALRSGRRYVARLERCAPRLSPLPAGPYQLDLRERGTIEQVRFAPLARQAPGPGEVEVAIRATGLNFRDVLNVLGMYPGNPGNPGIECAGTVTAVGEGVTHVRPGDPVIALGTGCFASHVLVRAERVFPKPAALSFAEAAAVPSAYLTAAYGLLHLAQLQPGQRVLIHAAAGGVGLAAVHIAQRRGAEVFATAGSPAKHAFLAKLGVRHRFSSRTLEFAEQISAVTDGAGVDVVLNSLADGFIPRSFDTLAPTGTFLELGKRGIWTTEEAAAVRPAAAYHVYDLGEVLRDQPGVLEDLLREVVDALATGELPLVPIRAFPAAATADAFRYMAQARHIGKVIVTQRFAGEALARPDGSYLITGGMGGIGLETARWLAEAGAGAVALLGRSEPNAAAREQIADLERRGTRVLTLRGDVSQESDLAAALATIDRDLPPLRGVFHAAGTTDDGVLSQQDWGRIAGVLAPKALGALHLDRLTREYDLDHFVLFSSASAVLGSPGQSGYAAANAALDGLAHARREAGLPALSVNWGSWERVGMAAALGEAHQRRMRERGMGMIAPERGLDALATALSLDVPQLAIMATNWEVIRRQAGPGAPRPLLRSLLAAAPAVSAEATTPIVERLASAAQEEHPAILADYLQGVIAGVLGLPAGQIRPDQSLTEFGFDSLMSVEVRNRVTADLGIALSPADILGATALSELAARALELLGAASAPSEAAPRAETDDTDAAQAARLLADLDQLSDADVDALLGQLVAGGRGDD